MYKQLVILLIATLSLVKAYGGNFASSDSYSDLQFNILQLNLWEECTRVENATQLLIEQISFVEPDIATFCELYKGEEDQPVIPLLLKGLADRGMVYHAARIDGRAVISKYPIVEQKRINRWMFKAVLHMKGHRVAVYPFHSEYRFYSCYLPKGYGDGSSNWDKLEMPITDVGHILSVNEQSGRVESTNDFLADAKLEQERGAFIFFAGDLNEPSHLDWQEDTKNMRDHNGCVVNWQVSMLLYANGYKDAYRQIYPNAVDYPGFTFPANNALAPISELTWAPQADERERIDFIYYYSDSSLRVDNAKLVGPSSSIVRSERVEENSKDCFVISDVWGWPTDHRGVLASFSICE